MARAKYREIADQLATEVALLPPGMRIAGESEIGKRFDVGRAAARSALQELERRLLVRRVQGVGTFTARRIDYVISPQHPPSWSRSVRAGGAVPRSIVRSCETVFVPDDVATVLDLQPGAPCHLLKRQSFTDDVPAAWGAEWVPIHVVSELATAVQIVDSLDLILRDMANAMPERAWSRASMEAADPAIARELGCSPGDAAWLVESLNRDARSGRLLCFTRRWMRADAVRVVIESGGRPLVSEQK